MFSIQKNCYVVLLADTCSYNGVYTLTAIPIYNSNTDSISIDAIRIKYGANTYYIDSSGVEVHF
jgi:hypothetical protein